jgi:hypothetical protein
MLLKSATVLHLGLGMHFLVWGNSRSYNWLNYNMYDLPAIDFFYHIVSGSM